MAQVAVGLSNYHNEPLKIWLALFFLAKSKYFCGRIFSKKQKGSARKKTFVTDKC